jgi:hypothetical protein
MATKHHQVPAINFIGTMMANVENPNLSDKDFRELFRNTIFIVEKPDFKDIANPEVKKRVHKFYDPKDLEE